VLAEPLETDPIDATDKIVLISRNVILTAEHLAILDECGINYYIDINFEVKSFMPNSSRW
jgi:hypothetical protein